MLTKLSNLFKSHFDPETGTPDFKQLFIKNVVSLPDTPAETSYYTYTEMVTTSEGQNDKGRRGMDPFIGMPVFFYCDKPAGDFITNISYVIPSRSLDFKDRNLSNHSKLSLMVYGVDENGNSAMKLCRP